MADKQQTRKEKELGLSGFILRPMYITMKQFIKACVNRPQTVLYPWEKLIFLTRSEGAQGSSSTSASGAGYACAYVRTVA